MIKRSRLFWGEQPTQQVPMPIIIRHQHRRPQINRIWRNYQIIIIIIIDTMTMSVDRPKRNQKREIEWERNLIAIIIITTIAAAAANIAAQVEIKRLEESQEREDNHTYVWLANKIQILLLYIILEKKQRERVIISTKIKR